MATCDNSVSSSESEDSFVSDTEIPLASGFKFEETSGDGESDCYSEVTLAEENYWEFQSALNKKDKGFNIFPKNIEEKIPDFVDNLRTLSSDWFCAVVVPGKQLLEGRDTAKKIPHGVLTDVCLFSHTQPVLLLTCVKPETKDKWQQYYNGVLAAEIEEVVVKKLHGNFSVAHGVVEDGMSTEFFSGTIKKLVSAAQVMAFSNSLLMSRERCLAVGQIVVEYLGGTSSPTKVMLVKEMEALCLSDDQQDLLYDEIKTSFITRVDAQQLMWYLKIDHANEDEICRIQQTKGLRHAASELLRILKMNFPNWIHQICGALRHSDIAMEDLANDIETKQATIAKSFERTPRQELFKDVSATLQTNTPVTRTGDTVRETGASTSRLREDNILHLVCKSAKIDMVKHIMLQNTIDKESIGMYGMTPLMNAAVKGHVELFNYLVSKGCVTGVSDYSENILHLACMAGSVQMVARILSMNVIDIESRGQYGRAPLMCAAEKGHVEVFDYLVNKGCSVTVVDDDNDNILHVACMAGSVQMVARILSMNVIDIESRGMYGRTPLMCAVNKGHVEVFDYLVNKGCSVTGVDDDNENILHVACIGGSVQMVGHILSMNVIDIESRGKYGRTPLMHAAVEGHVEVFDYLVNKGCSVTGVDEEGSNYNVLHLACCFGKTEIVRRLLRMSCVSEMKSQRDRFGDTAVECAVSQGHTDIVTLFAGSH